MGQIINAIINPFVKARAAAITNINGSIAPFIPMSRVAASPYIHNILHTYTEQKIIKIKTSVEFVNDIDT